MTPSTERPRRIRRWLRAHPVLTAAGALGGAGALAFVLIWFQPQALLFDRVVDEDFPAAPAASDAPSEDGDGPAPASEADDGTDPPSPGSDDADGAEDGDGAGAAADPQPRALLAGSFEGRGRYTVTGEATVYVLADGSRSLRLEPFESTNGPDLFVYLTRADAADDDAALDADAVDLGRLRGNIGNQNYAIPDDVDLDRYDTAVIWCLRFAVAFGAADLAVVAE